MKKMISFFLAVTVLSSLSSCKEDAASNTGTNVQLKNHSVTPALVKGLPAGVEVFSLFSSDDQLSQSPSWVFGGGADGMGLIKNSDGTFTMLVNNEDNFAVSRVTLDETFKPIKGEYILNSTAGQWRLCSATLATPDEHGFGPLFLTCGETNAESMVHAVNPAGGLNTSTILTAFGHWQAENALPLPKEAYPGKTVILLTDDDSGPGGGQVAMYISNTVGDLTNGSIYVLARNDENMRERDMTVGTSYPITFKKIDNIASMTGAEINTSVVPTLKAMKFGRTEDIDYRKGGQGRELYFVATGQDYTGANADSSRTKFGRAYKIVLDASDPTKGTLECILDGDDRGGKAGKFQNPDNVCVTTNYVYIQEDPNKYGGGQETHDAYIYQYDISSNAVKVVMELDHHRGEPGFEKYNTGSDAPKLGAWEYGAMVDALSLLGIENTFILCVQPHTWQDDKYKNPDGGTNATAMTFKEASQVLVVKGLPR